MLQYGKPINKNSKSIDLKIEYLCLSLGMRSLFEAAFYLFPAGAVVFVAKA
jgi:hypothetical protein